MGRVDGRSDSDDQIGTPMCQRLIERAVPVGDSEPQGNTTPIYGHEPASVNGLRMSGGKSKGAPTRNRATPWPKRAVLRIASRKSREMKCARGSVIAHERESSRDHWAEADRRDASPPSSRVRWGLRGRLSKGFLGAAIPTLVGFAYHAGEGHGFLFFSAFLLMGSACFSSRSRLVPMDWAMLLVLPYEILSPVFSRYPANGLLAARIACAAALLYFLARLVARMSNQV